MPNKSAEVQKQKDLLQRQKSRRVNLQRKVRCIGVKSFLDAFNGKRRPRLNLKVLMENGKIKISKRKSYEKRSYDRITSGEGQESSLCKDDGMKKGTPKKLFGQ